MSLLRIRLFRMLGASIGAKNRMERVRLRDLRSISIGSGNAFAEGCWLMPVTSKASQGQIRIGSRNFFNRHVMIDACGEIAIGDDNMFGPGVYVTDSNHTRSASTSVSRSPMSIGRVRIGNGCWLGAGAMILKDVELGDGCTVGAGSVVTKSVPAGAVVGGVPARPLSKRRESAVEK